MQTHKELKDFIKHHDLVSNMDHIIACNKHGWTDLRFTQLDKRLTPESKYFLAVNIDNFPRILHYNKLLDLRYEIDEKMIKGTYYKGYDEKNNRVHLHYEGEGIFRIGNINENDSAFRVQFEECSLKELTKRHDYSLYISLLNTKEKHRSIQVLLSELGVSLGFNVKLAQNDAKVIYMQNPSLLIHNVFLDFNDLNLCNIVEKRVKKDIDMIDVLWCDSVNKRVVVAFEVEFSNNYSQLFQRFSSLSQSIPYPVQLVGVGDAFNKFKDHYNRPVWQSTFSHLSLGYLPLKELCDLLTLNKELGSFTSSLFLYKKLIYEKLLSVNSFI